MTDLAGHWLTMPKNVGEGQGPTPPLTTRRPGSDGPRSLIEAKIVAWYAPYTRQLRPAILRAAG
jgi:hypothetical protein